MAPLALRLLVLVPILLSLVASRDWKAERSQDPFEKCMQDPDYEQLLKVTILEADNRIGGRIFTYRDQNTGWIGELGAMRMPSSHRILHKLCQGLGLNLTKFTQYDKNTWTEVHEVKLRNYVVEKVPEKLGYALRPQEKGHSPEDIYQMAL
ncbi:IL4I1 isoform 5, partial [Pan troglodytes]